MASPDLQLYYKLLYNTENRGKNTCKVRRRLIGCLPDDSLMKKEMRYRISKTDIANYCVHFEG